MKEAGGLAHGRAMTPLSSSQASGSQRLAHAVELACQTQASHPHPIIFLLWEVGVRLHWINGNILPAPSATIYALIDLAEAGYLWRDIWASVLRVTIGFGIAAIAAVSLGLALGIWRTAAAYIMPLVELLRPISVLAWIPLAILWFGLGDHSAWFIIFLGSFFPIFTNTYLGARSVAPIHLQVSQCFGAGKWLFLRRVMFPSRASLHHRRSQGRSRGRLDLCHRGRTDRGDIGARLHDPARSHDDRNGEGHGRHDRHRRHRLPHEQRHALA